MRVERSLSAARSANNVPPGPARVASRSSGAIDRANGSPNCRSLAASAARSCTFATTGSDAGPRTAAGSVNASSVATSAIAGSAVAGASAGALSAATARSAPSRPASSGTAATSLGAFRRDDQLQQFFGIIQKLVGLLGIHPQRTRRKLRSHRGLRHRRVRGHEANLVHVNELVALQGFLQLLGELNGFGAAAGWKCANEFLQAGVRQFR